MNIILFGFKGSGKTHFGKILATQLKKTFIDTDVFIENQYYQRTGKKSLIRDIYNDLGESGFRSLEKKAILELLTISNAVIALGGGTALNLDLMEKLQKIGQLIYLETKFETIEKRVFKHGTPSFVNPHDPAESLRQIYRERKPIYESIPAEKINTDLLDEAGVIAAILSIVYRKDNNGI